MALWIGSDYEDFRGEIPIGRGWREKAKRLLEGLPRAAEHAWLPLFEAEAALLLEGDSAVARRCAQEAVALARQCHVPDIQIVALAAQGLAQVEEGDIDAGMRCLDEAVATALAGELEEQFWANRIVCYLIFACERVRDHDRAAQWCHRMREVADYRDFMESAPNELGGGALYVVPREEAIAPAHLLGTIAFGLLVVYAGDEDQARKAAAPLLGLDHEGGMIAEMPYAEMQCMFDDPPGFRNAWAAEFLSTFPDAAVDAFCAIGAEMPMPSSSVHLLFPQGGAVSGSDRWPLPWRREPWCVHPLALWDEPADDDRLGRWTRRIYRELQPWASGTIHLNFIGDEGRERLIAAFGRDHYTRLAEVKARYDPENVFRASHNIEPA
jgi:FAD/FMN-containing dehydrogenase